MAGNITAPRLRELLHYEPEAGVFTWLSAAGARGRIKAGTVAGTKRRDGYIQIQIEGAIYTAHRLAWLYMTGEWPSGGLDHKHGVRDDNRWSELRAATQLQNLQNLRRAKSNNRTGLLGVSVVGRGGKFKSEIQAGGKKSHLGYFGTPEAAHAAYLEAKAVLHEYQTLSDRLGAK